MNCCNNNYNCLVYDIGSSFIRCGQAGYGFPDISQPTICSENPDGSISFYISSVKNQEIKSIIDSSYSFTDKNIMGNFFKYSIDKIGVTFDEELNALFTYPGHLASSSEHRLKWQSTLCEVGFEETGFHNISLVSDASLSAYAHCLQTALVVDFGWSSLRIVPVVEGIPQYNQIKIHPIGGFGLCQLLNEQLKLRNINTFNDQKLSNEQNEYFNRRILTDILHSCCSFAQSVIDEDFLYFLNERPIDLKSEMTLISKIHFNELEGDTEDDNVPSIIELIKSAINECNDVEKRNLWGNIVTSGGFAGLNSFIDNLQIGLKETSDPRFNVKVNYPMSCNISFDQMVWTGGSIFGSSSVFHHFLISKEDWEENGESLLNVKFK